MARLGQISPPLGHRVEDFDDPIPNFAEGLDGTDRAILYSHRNFAERQIWHAYPAADEDNTGASASRNNEVLVYNFESPSFSRYDYNYQVGSEFNKSLDGKTWADITSSWPAINISWSDFRVQTPLPELFIGQESGIILRVNRGATDSGANINFEVLSKRLVPFADAQAQLGWIDFLFTANEDTTLECSVYSDWDPNSRVTGNITLDSTITGADKVWKQFPVNLISQAFRFEMKNNKPNQNIELHAAVFYFRKAGKLTI